MVHLRLIRELFNVTNIHKYKYTVSIIFTYLSHVFDWINLPLFTLAECVTCNFKTPFR
jgi:hypothetical protein